MAETKKTYCRNCGAVCGMEVELEDNRIIAISGDKDNPETEGYFCVKGQTSMDFHNGEDRLMNCRKRLPDGTFDDIDQETLVDEVAGQLKQIIEQHGPRAVAFFNGTHGYGTLSMPLTKSLLHCIGTPNVFSTMTIDQSAKWICHGRLGMVPTWKYSDLEADVLMVVGNNPVISHMGKPWSGIKNTAPTAAIKAAKKRGMKLIVVDPRRTETAKLADIHLQIKPGDDPVLFAGLIHISIKNGWYNQAFCERYTQQFEELRQAVEPFNADFVSRRLGIPAETLAEAAQLFGSAKKASAGSGTGSNMNRNSNLSEHMMETYNAICGGYRKPGDEVPNPGALTRGVPETFSIIPSIRTWESEPKAAFNKDIGQMYGEFPSGILPDEITADSPDRIRALIVLGGNPVQALGDPGKTIPAFETLDLMITVDPRMTDTAKLSHYVVAPVLPYERHDLTIVNDLSYHLPFAQYAQPIMEAPPGTLPDWELIWGIAKRLGYQLEMKPPIFGAAFDALPDGYKLDMEQKPTQERLIEELLKMTPVSLETLQAHPSGYAPEMQPLTIRAAEEDDGARLSLMPDDVAAELGAEIKLRAHDSDFPLLLSSRRMLQTMNGSFTDAARTRKRHPINPVFMHPDDLSTYDLEDGADVMVESRFGQIAGVLEADASMKPGVVALTHMWGSSLEHAGTNPRGSYTGRLTSLTQNLQSLNNMPHFSGVEVSVRVAG